MHRGLLLLSLAAALPASGCCSLARFFCGPDRTPWVSVDYTTPERAARTLLEAIRRDEPEIVYRSLSNAYRQQNQLDQAGAVLAWQRLREQNPGLHVAGYAEVPAATPLGPDRARIEVDVEGNRIEIVLVRQRKWEVRWRRPNGTPAEHGLPVATFEGMATIAENDDGSTATLRAPLTFRIGAELPPLAVIEFAGLVAEWKVDHLAMLVDG
jgi:hypothetical protein